MPLSQLLRGPRRSPAGHTEIPTRQASLPFSPCFLPNGWARTYSFLELCLPYHQKEGRDCLLQTPHCTEQNLRPRMRMSLASNHTVVTGRLVLPGKVQKIQENYSRCVKWGGIHHGPIRTCNTTGKAGRAKVRRTAISFQGVVSRVLALLKLARAWKPDPSTDLRHLHFGRPL